MTQLLVSVTNVEEAKVAIENGADIIDLKDPQKGALGALSIDQINAVVAYVNSQNSTNIKTSATIGDIPMKANLIANQVAELGKTNIDFIKIGFFETEDYQPCLDALSAFVKMGKRLIAILFAETTYPVDMIKRIKQAGFVGVLIDTMNKNGLTLLDFYSEEKRQEFVKEANKHELQFGLAGSLKLQHVEMLNKLNPNYMGFRGGVCEGNQRQLELNPDKIQAIRKLL